MPLHKKTRTQQYIGWPLWIRILLGIISFSGVFSVFFLLHKHTGPLGWPDYIFAMVTIGILTSIAVPEVMLPIIGKISPTIQKRLSGKFIAPPNE